MPAPAAAGPVPFGPAVACALLLGVAWLQGWPALPPAWLAAALLPIGLRAWWTGGAARLPGALGLGLCLAALHAQAVLDARWPMASDRQGVWVVGTVATLPVAEAGSVRFDLRVEAMEGVDQRLVGGRVRVGWFVAPGQAPPEVRAGSRWRLRLRLRAPEGLANPGGFDLGRHAASQGLLALAQVDGNAGAWQWAQGQGLPARREGMAHRIARAVPDPGARFVQALALGDTRGLDDADWDVLRITGLTHLIAISGFHVGLVAGFGAWCARAAWWLLPALSRRLPRPQAAALAAVAAAAGYTALAGFALPTVRTWLMIAVVAWARVGRRAASGAQALALAVVAILLLDPLAVLAPGFWLSVAGVAWLLWCLPAGADAGSPLRALVQAQGVATLGLLPLTVAFFQQASLVGPLANLVGIPWISLGVVPLALLGVLLDPVHAGAAALAWQAAAALMQALWRGLEIASGWPMAFSWLPEPGAPALCLAAIAALWLTLPRGTPGKALACLLWLPLAWPADRAPPPGSVDIVQFDVGQGLAVLVRTHRHQLLYDAGPAPARGIDAGEAAVLPALRALGVRRLDTVVLSHGDNDHAGGFGSVARGMPVSRVLAAPGWAHGTMAACIAGDAWHWDGVDFEVLHPPLSFPYRRNESSCVLSVRAGGRHALLPGDIGRHIEGRLARAHGPALQADLLLVPHHGSDGSSSLDFLAAVRPTLALLSAGRGNRFDLPAPRAMDRYDRYRVRVLDSMGQGALHLRLDDRGVRVLEAFRPDRRRWWRHAGDPAGYAIGDPDSDPDR